MDLFDKLKSEPAVEKIRKPKSNEEIIPVLRESSPLATSEIAEVDTSHVKEKSRSLSPLKLEEPRSVSPPKLNTTKTPNKQVRVLLERTKLPLPINMPQEQNLLNKPIKNITPTKAQQKQFDPAVLRKAQELQKFRVRSCFVRLKRANLKKLQKDFAKKFKVIKTITKSQTTKRAHTAAPETTSPPAKKSKSDKGTSGFFVKITSPTSRKSTGRTSSPLMRNERNEWPKAKSSANTSKLSVKPTKFTRTELIEKFGKKYFSAVVKIERCDHPLMVAFESEAREQRSKRNKSKNLSVSFHKEVEILDQSPKSRTSKKSPKKPIEPTIPLVPARLQKIENGKVVNDIELDQSIFLNSSADSLVASTPIVVSRTKKRGRPISHIVPLKDENTQSLRLKNFKLANENTMDGDDDEEVEFIVPEVDIPEKLKTSFLSNAKVNNISKIVESTLSAKGKHAKSKKEMSPITKLSPTNTAPVKTTPTKSKSTKSTPTKSTSTKRTPTKSTPTKATPTKATPTKATLSKAKAKPRKETPSKSMSSKTKKSTESTKITTVSESTTLSSTEEEVNFSIGITHKNTETVNTDMEQDINREIKGTTTVSDTDGNTAIETTITKASLSTKNNSDNANSSGESFLSAIAEIIENSAEKNKENTENNSGTENARNRIETETISESSNASTDVQINTSKTTTTTTTPTTCTEKTPRSTAKKSLKDTYPNEKSNDIFDKIGTKKQLSYDETTDDMELQQQQQQLKSTTKQSNENSPNKSFSSETLNAVEAALKTYTQSIISKSSDIDDIDTVTTDLDLPINLLSEDADNTADVSNKVENIITELSKDLEGGLLETKTVDQQ